MKTIAIVANPSGDKNFEYSKKLIRKLNELGVKVLSDREELTGKECIKDYDELFKNADLGITLGGDGTLLRVSEYAAKYDIPLLGMNLGRLGFLVELEKNDENKITNMLLTGNYKSETRMRIEASVIRDNKVIHKCSSLNDIVIIKGNILKMIHLRLDIDDVYINDYYADGIIFAAPTGTTAYSMSAGGPVVHPSLEAMTITPVCPHTFTVRPMVVSANQKAVVTVDIRHDEDVVLFSDGAFKAKLEKGDMVKITASDLKTTLIRLEDRSFFDVLNKKLSERK